MYGKTIKIVVSTLCIFLLLTGCNSTKAHIQSSGGVKINVFNTALGAVNETDLNRTKLSYSFSLTNDNDREILIKDIQPILNKEVQSMLIDNDIAVTVNKDIKPNETIQISGELIFESKGFTKSDIVNLEPFITDIIVSTDEVISLNH